MDGKGVRARDARETGETGFQGRRFRGRWRGEGELSARVLRGERWKDRLIRCDAAQAIRPDNVRLARQGEEGFEVEGFKRGRGG